MDSKHGYLNPTVNVTNTNSSSYEYYFVDKVLPIAGLGSVEGMALVISGPAGSVCSRLSAANDLQGQAEFAYNGVTGILTLDYSGVSGTSLLTANISGFVRGSTVRIVAHASPLPPPRSGSTGLAQYCNAVTQNVDWNAICGGGGIGSDSMSTPVVGACLADGLIADNSYRVVVSDNSAVIPIGLAGFQGILGYTVAVLDSSTNAVLTCATLRPTTSTTATTSTSTVIRAGAQFVPVSSTSAAPTGWVMFEASPNAPTVISVALSPPLLPTTTSNNNNMLALLDWYISPSCDNALVFDPFMSSANACALSAAQCAVGNLTIKHGLLNISSSSTGRLVFSDVRLPLSGIGSIVGAALVLRLVNSTSTNYTNSWCAPIHSMATPRTASSQVGNVRIDISQDSPLSIPHVRIYNNNNSTSPVLLPNTTSIMQYPVLTMIASDENACNLLGKPYAP